MTRADRIALALSLFSILVTWYVTERYFEAIPHLEDEIAYVWQAEAIAGGQLTVESPPEPKSFLVPFVVDYNGQRFGKYPLGWPALLAVGVKLGVRPWINPLLAGLGIWLTYRLGKKLLGETVGLLAVILTLTSPFFLMNSGSLLSHPLGLLLSAAFSLAWIDNFGERDARPRWVPTITAGLTLGVLALTRPFTAVAVGFPFMICGLYFLIRGSNPVRLHVLVVGAIAVSVGSLNLLWQYAVSGDPLLNPYTLWWSYDTVGFGAGHGRVEGGHNMHLAMINTRFSLQVGAKDLFGWLSYSWAFLPIGLLAILWRRIWKALPVIALFPCLVLFYLAYWVGSWLFGPRYYYEGLFSLTILTAAGIAWLAGWPTLPGEVWRRYAGWKKIRPLLIFALLILLLASNLYFYTPQRLAMMHGLYGMERADLEPFQTAQARELTPALIVVHPQVWMDYGVLLELQDPFLDTPFIFVFYRGDQPTAQLAQAFPDRRIYHYYPEEPFVFFTAPK